jgi:hypothetical protein
MYLAPMVGDLPPNSPFTIRTVLDRVERMGDPMAALLETPVEIAAVKGKLAGLVPPKSRR